MSKLIDNIKRLAGMVKNETKSGGNTAVRVGGLFEEMAAELENKYDKTESDQLMSRHNTVDDSHLNIQERIDTALGDLNRNKLDKTGNGSDVTVHFNEAAERRNVSSGDTLSVLLGKVQKWFAGLQAVAFSGKAADLAEDTTHRFLMDTERTKLNGIETGANKYIHPTAHPATMITDDAAHRFVSDTEKNAWNGKAAGTHTHPATQVTEDATHLFLTDAERTKLNGIEMGANKYTHPTTHPATLIMQDTTHRFVSDTDKTNWNSKAAGNHNHNGTYAPVSHNHTADQISDTATKVMMTASERSKLAGIETQTITPIAYIQIKENIPTFISSYNFTLERNVDAFGNPSGEYIFYHDIGNENYTVMITGTSYSVYGSIVGKLADVFAIHLFDYQNAVQNGNFDIIVFKVD